VIAEPTAYLWISFQDKTAWNGPKGATAAVSDVAGVADHIFRLEKIASSGK